MRENIMNNKRRSDLQRLSSQLEQILSELETIQSDEETSRDNIPENLWNTERYEQSEMACDSLGEAVDGLSSVIENISDAIG
jgi:hypothetical protein